MTTASGREQWRDLARRVLVRSGATADVDPETSLRRVVDGVPVEALYAGDNAAAPVALRGRFAEWDIRQRFGPDDDLERLNREVLADLSGGVTSVWLSGVPAAAVSTVLSGVLLDVAGVALDGDPAVLDAVWTLTDDTSTVHGSLGIDPLAVARSTGRSLDCTAAATWADRCATDAPMLRAVLVDASALHVDGADTVGQLAWSLVTGAAYLRALTDTGLSVSEAVAQLEVRWAVTDDQFLSLAMLRAARRVWDRVVELCGGADSNVTHHAVTSPLMMTQRDPWTNLLRTTVAGLAAAVGGADAITVLPFDHALGRPDALGRRIARNTHQVLAAEASLARVADPAAGSWYVETLTDQLATAAWERFTAIERAGGLAAALDDGTLRADLDTARDRTAAAIARREHTLVGVTRFVAADESLPARDGPVAADTTGRWSVPFEALRDRADVGDRPTVVLVGDERRDVERLAFARDLFAAGGVSAQPGDPAGADLVCVCTDAPADSADVAGTRRTWHVGPDGLHDGVDVLAVLTDVWAAHDEAVTA